MRASVDNYGQTTVMVTHEARAAAIADRVLFPRRRADREGAERVRRASGARGHEHAELVIGVALKGLLGRKLRAALTAVAIVLGVAMVSGTFVLTDTIKAAFNTVFTQVYKSTDAVITGKSAIGGNQNNNVVVPSLPQSLLARVRSLPGVLEAKEVWPTPCTWSRTEAR